MKLYHLLDVTLLASVQAKVLDMFEKDETYRSQIALFYPKNAREIRDVPEIKDFLNEVGLYDGVVSVAFNIMLPGKKFSIHTDSNNFTYSLNIPIASYDDSKVSFYTNSTKSNNTLTFDSTQHNTRVSANEFIDEECVLIEEVTPLVPYILNTSVPHRVTNGPNSTRIMMLCRLDPKLDTLICERYGFDTMTWMRNHTNPL